MITLATLNDATEQEVFDQIARHLLTQGKPSRDADGNCVYRNNEGLMCAAGCLLTNEEYNPSFDEDNGKPWAYISAGRNHKTLIVRLQEIHDGYHHTTWETTLRFTAQIRGLKWNLD